MTRKQAIEAIKKGTHVLDVERHSKEAKSFVEGEFDCAYFNDRRYYGKDEDRCLIFLNEYEINNRPIIKLSDILESTNETAISETKDMREYDERLLKEFCEGWKQSVDVTLNGYVKQFLKDRYPDKELEELIRKKQEAQSIVDECEKRIQELKND